MRRVPGVSVQDGKYVYIRGLGDRYSKTTLNGANIPGLDPDRNTVQMDLFPTNLLDNIVVYKNFTPDLPGDFTGGLVDVATKDFPEDFTMAASLGFGYNPQVTFNDNFLTYNGGNTDWLGYDDGARDFPAALNSMPTFGQALSDQAAAKELNAATLSLNNELAPHTNAPMPNHNFSFSIGDQKNLFGKDFGFIGSLSFYMESNPALTGKVTTDHGRQCEPLPPTPTPTNTPTPSPTPIPTPEGRKGLIPGIGRE